jgi:asparagine synthetase B (glutamine-hydrolysing)
MCSFLVTTKEVSREKLLEANYYQKYRGPDATNVKEYNGITLLHNLLSITGEFTLQPFIEDDILAIYNGEIYNYSDLNPDAISDGFCLIPSYRNYGDYFLQKLDGEFAIVLIDLKKQKIIFGVDTFGCKPLFYSLDNGYHFASYKSALEKLDIKNIKQVDGNEWFIFDIKTKSLEKKVVSVFDVDNEYKDSFEDWNLAFEQSIKKRAISHKPVMMGVSEGYDSGCISCALVANDIDFKMYSVNVLDTPSNVLLWRHDMKAKTPPDVENIKIKIPNIKNKQFIDPNLMDHIKICSNIYKKCEPYEYTYYDHNINSTIKKICRNTYGFLGAGLILKTAREEGYRICLSGLAGDIIGCPEINQKIKTLNNLNYVVDFDDNNVYSCEYCCGVHGIEIRYPFLDTKLWQETLWLNKKIYKKWKHPQRQYMLKHQFPFVDIDNKGEEIFEKVGFYKPMPSTFEVYREKLCS